MHELPEWLLHSDCPPPEVREKLAAMLPTGPDACCAIDNLCLIAHDFACTNIEQRRYQSVYNRQKRRAGSKNPHPGTQHAGEELELIKKAAKALYDAIHSSGPRARALLNRELRKRQVPASVDIFPGLDPERLSLLVPLYEIIVAIDGDAEEGREGLLAQVSRPGRPPEGIDQLVDGIGQEHRYALGRVPSHSELEKLLTAIFGNQCGFGYVKEWCKWANRRDRWEWAASAYAIPATPHHPLNSLIFRCTKIVTFKQPPFAK